ncbi:MAG: DUF4097 family beta strand repeat-containing protein [Myxococcota bacterium]
MLLTLLACGLVETETEHAALVEDGPFAHVEIELGAGDVVVRGDPEATGADGTFTATFSETPPAIEHWVDDGVLHVEGACVAIQAVCELSLAVTLPADVSVTIATGSGDAVVEGIVGDLVAESGTGDVTARGLAGYAELKTGSGDVCAESEGFDRIEAETGSGDIVVTVPPGVYALTAESGSGDVDVAPDVRSDGAAEAVIVAQTGSGDVSILVP